MGSKERVREIKTLLAKQGYLNAFHCNLILTLLIEQTARVMKLEDDLKSCSGVDGLECCHNWTHADWLEAAKKEWGV